MATVKITNTLTTVIADATGIEAVISPTGITKPCTPVQEYVGDMATIVDGTLLIPAYNKVQMLSVPVGSYISFDVTEPKEINYWENIHVEGAKITVTNGITTFVPVVTYTLLTEQPADWAKNYKNYFTKSGDEYTAVTGDTAPEFADGTYYKKSETKCPTNNI